MHSRARVYPRGSPTQLRQIFFSGTCLSNTCFTFVLLSDTCFSYMCVRNTCFMLFFVRNMCFDDTCFRSTCYMFVLLTLTIPRSFYFTEYEILTGVPNYWAPSSLGGVIPILGCHVGR